MVARFIEVVKLDNHVIGTIENKKKKFVRHKYLLGDISEYLDSYRKAHTGFNSSIIHLKQDASKKFQIIGVDRIEKQVEQNTTFYHLRISLIKREQGEINIRNLRTKLNRRITMVDGEEYEARSYHVTLVPTMQAAILDQEVTFGPLQELIKNVLCRFLDHNDYQLDTAKQLKDGIRSWAVSDLKDEFKKKLKEMGGFMKEVSCTIAKPTSQSPPRNADEHELKQSSEAWQIVGDVVSKLFGVDVDKTNLLNCPFRRIKVTINLDERANKRELKQIRGQGKKNLGQIADNKFLNSAFFTYADDETAEDQRVLLRGMAARYESTLSHTQSTYAAQVWPEHRKKFFLWKRGN